MSLPTSPVSVDSMPETEATTGNAMPSPIVPVVLFTKDIHMRRFFGTEGEGHLAEEFEEEIRRAWDAQPGITAERKMDLLKSNVGPVVRDELRCQEEDIQKDAEKALRKIVEVFGERRTPSALLQCLFNLQQNGGETIRAYSHRIKAAHDRYMKRMKVLGMSGSSEDILRDHFVNSLTDLTLIRYLRERIHQNESVTFKELRETAIRWAGDEETATASSSAVVAAKAAPPSTDSLRLDKLEEQGT